MSATWSPRFANSTRGRLIVFLRRGARTVDEMATALNLTDNAVRVHLAALERDGLVRQGGARHAGGVGKPAYTYGLTAEAENLFPKPYSTVLDHMIASLDGRLSPQEVEEVLRTAGRRMASKYPAADGDRSLRLQVAADALTQIGGLAELDERDDGTVEIRGYSCPLGALVPDHPEVCNLAAAFVSEIARVKMCERCDRETPPRCRFQLVDQS
jgi:predicted ArsR family transcriptional regulator